MKLCSRDLNENAVCWLHCGQCIPKLRCNANSIYSPQFICYFVGIIRHHYLSQHICCTCSFYLLCMYKNQSSKFSLCHLTWDTKSKKTDLISCSSWLKIQQRTRSVAVENRNLKLVCVEHVFICFIELWTERSQIYADMYIRPFIWPSDTR